MLKNYIFQAPKLIKQISLLNITRNISETHESLNAITAQQQIIKDSDYSVQTNAINKLFGKVNDRIAESKCGRSFAVIHFMSAQYLVHCGDIVKIKNSVQADIGEQIKLEKCVLVGNEQFTLIGRPILNRDLVNVTAIVLEKTMTNTYYIVKAKPRTHRYRRWRFTRFPITMLRINQIDYCHQLNQTQLNVQ